MKNVKLTTKRTEKLVTQGYLDKELQVTREYFNKELRKTEEHFNKELRKTEEHFNKEFRKTEEHLNEKFITKDYLNKKFEEKFNEQNERNLKCFATKDELQEIKENMMTKADKNEIMTILDKINKTLIDIKTELAANVGAHERYDERFNDHEERLRYLEACPVMRC
jgi:hypothetical protein